MANPVRVYLAGAVTIEAATVLLQRALGTPQTVMLFARLCAEPGHTVSRDGLVDAIWPTAAPESTDVALSALVSRLRTAIRPAGFDVSTSHRAYELSVPAGVWIDLQAAESAADEAEGRWRAGRTHEAWSVANVAVAIAQRGFLPEHRGPWAEQWRSRLRATHRRGLHILCDVSAAAGEMLLAARYGEELVVLDPFRETGYQQLMNAHAAAGNRAEALLVYARLRDLLRDELGTSPSPETEAVYLRILQA